MTVHYRSDSVQSVDIVHSKNDQPAPEQAAHDDLGRHDVSHQGSLLNSLSLRAVIGILRPSHDAERQRQHGWYAARTTGALRLRQPSHMHEWVQHSYYGEASVYLQTCSCDKDQGTSAPHGGRGRRSAWRGRVCSFIVSMTTGTSRHMPKPRTRVCRVLISRRVTHIFDFL